MKHLLTLIAFACFTITAHAHGSITWAEVHDQIEAQDKDLIIFIDQTFDVSRTGGAMRPISGDHAGERFAPYDFYAKSKGTTGGYILSLMLEPSDRTDHAWKVTVQKRWD